MARFFPEEWERFRRSVSADGDVVAAYARLMEDPDPQVRNQAAVTGAAGRTRSCPWSRTRRRRRRGPAGQDTLAFVRITAHYYAQAGFLEEGAVIRDAGRLAGIPGVLIHGRLDLSCPATTAVELARAWPGAELLIDDHSGHRGSPVKRAWMLDTLSRFAAR